MRASRRSPTLTTVSAMKCRKNPVGFSAVTSGMSENVHSWTPITYPV